MVKKQHYIQALIAQGEHLHLDFKFQISDAAKIARSLVAFANTKGGKLLIGVKDNGAIAGVRSSEEYFMVEHAARQFCIPEVAFTSKEWKVEDKKVLEVSIPRSAHYPHKAPDPKGRYKAYFRYKDQNLLVNGVMMKVWKKKQSVENISIVYGENERKLLQYLEIHPHIDLDGLRALCQISKYKAENLLADFIIFELLEMIVTDDAIVFSLKR